MTGAARPLTALAAAAIAVAACGPAATTPAAPSATAARTVAATPTATPAPVKYARAGTINFPKDTASFDFAVIDPSTKTLYLADRTNGGVSVVSLANEKYVSTITGFSGLKGSKDSGPNGVALIPDLNQLWATDGNSSVKMVDLKTNTVVGSVSTGGKARGDDLAYDPKDRIVVVGNDAEATPFLTFISTGDRKILGKLEFPGVDGIEGILWSDSRAAFFVSVPNSKTNPGGEIHLVDPKAMKVTQTYPVKDCQPHGIAFGPSNQLLLGCSGDAIAAGSKAQTLILDSTNGSVLATVPEFGGSDIVAFNPTNNLYFLAGSNMTADGTKAGTAAPQLGVINAKTNKLVQTFPTLKSAHTLVVDPATNRVYVPIPNAGIAVFAPAS